MNDEALFDLLTAFLECKLNGESKGSYFANGHKYEYEIGPFDFHITQIPDKDEFNPQE